MDVTDIFLQELQVDSSHPSVDKAQQKLFSAIKKGDLEKVRGILSFSPGKYDLDRLASSGKTVLQVAADIKDVAVRNQVVRALVNGGANLELGLLHAVHDGDIKTVQILLQVNASSSHPSQLLWRSFSLQGETCYVTPLILAACLQNFQIVKLLLEHGFTISDPNNLWWAKRSNEIACEKFGPSVYSLNRYRALASPVFIVASFLHNVQSGPDPIYRACALSKELRDTAEQEYEFRSEYFELSDGCEGFAVRLLNECRTMEEIRCVMQIKYKRELTPNSEENALDMLEFAISTTNRKFVSHPFSQLILNSEVYRNVPLLEKSAWKQVVLILLAALTYPLLFIVWLLFYSCFPNHDVARMFHSPCVKFLIFCGSHQTFLVLLAVTSFHSAFLGYTIVDWAVFIFVIGYLVDIVKNILQQGRARFFSYYWNYLAVVSTMLFAIHYAIWWTSRVTLSDTLHSAEWNKHAENRSYSVMLASESFMALGILIAFTRNFSFIQASSSTGPLLHAFIQMLIDVAKFFLYFVFVFLAFAVSFTKLYLQYQKAREYFLLSQGGANQTIPLDLESFGSSMNTIFWTLFGQIDENSFKINESGYGAIWKTGMTLFGAFNIVAVLVALNMLIAILNQRYTSVTQNLDTEWKFTRTKLWLSWIYKKGVLPPPFNILYVLLPVQWVVKRLLTVCLPEAILLFFRKMMTKRPGTTLKVKKMDEQQRREVIRHLCMRYLAKKSCYSENENEWRDSEDENDNKATLHNMNTNGLPNKIETMDISKLVIKRKRATKS